MIDGLRNSQGYPAPTVNWADFPDWVRERVVEQGIDPDLVVALQLGHGVFPDETYIARIDVGYIE